MWEGLEEDMRTSNNGKRRLWDIILPLLLCLCFIASSLLFLVHMIVKNQEENVEYLYNAANQKKTSIVNLIEGDIQTLEGLAIVLGGMENTDREELMPILKEINDENAFIRMGFAEVDGDAWLVDTDGEVYEKNLKEMKFFKEALKGNNNISDVFLDDFREDHYINYYGVNIKSASGEVLGVLCAVHSADVLRSIIDSPVLSGQGFSNIVDGKGNYILRSSEAIQADITEKNKKLIRDVVEEGGTAALTMEDRYGRKQRVAIVPLLKERWYLLSLVPRDVLRARYIETAIGIMVIIIVACCLFALFIARQRITASKAQKMLIDLAYQDSLTGLRNYDGFKLDAKSILSRNDLSSYVVWYGDLKKFKFINDILGYEEGDKILKLISGRLHQQEGKDSIVCRVSADNFAGIVKCKDSEQLRTKVFEVQEYLKELGIESVPFIELAVGFYKLCPGDGELSVDVLVNYANMAHKIAKERPGTDCEFYDSRIRERQIEDSMLEAEFQKALEAGEFKVYMQPKVNIQDHNILAGAEVLVRWISPSKGMIPPDRFISLFEKSDRIVMLDRYMFEQTCKWFSQYIEEGGRLINIAVNVSKVGILRKDFIQYYSDIKEKYSIPDGFVELEFTEGVMLNDTDVFSEIVMGLKSRGFICSLDDFGSGYSSLNLLKDLPIDVLKLDIMFFSKSKDVERERTVITHFIHMARELKIKTIAEGVENVENVEFLKDCGCNVVQGYVFSKPIPLYDFDRLARDLGDKPLVPKDAV